MPKGLTTGISVNEKETDLYVFPNPVTGEIVNVNTNTSGTIKLMDILGREIAKYEINKDGILQIKVSDLLNAVYYLQSMNGKILAKIVVNR
jgi:hypothetical protein